MRVVGSLRGRSLFGELRSSKSRSRSGPLTVVWVETEGLQFNVAYAIGRKTGGAVIRNRIRRRLRALCSEEKTPMQPGNYLIVVGPAARDLTYDQLGDHLRIAVGRLTNRMAAKS